MPALDSGAHDDCSHIVSFLDPKFIDGPTGPSRPLAHQTYSYSNTGRLQVACARSDASLERSNGPTPNKISLYSSGGVIIEARTVVAVTDPGRCTARRRTQLKHALLSPFVATVPERASWRGASRSAAATSTLPPRPCPDSCRPHPRTRQGLELLIPVLRS